MQSSRGTLISSTKKSIGRAETVVMEVLGNYENTMHAMLQIRVFAENEVKTNLMQCSAVVVVG